jgi:ABC-2 type transport system ATP-binding protein
MIEVRDLRKHYGAMEAVAGLSFQVSRGELFCFLGPNGAGKTTTIKMLCGLLKPTSGRIVIGGVDLQADPLAVRRFTGYIPDTPFLYDLLTLTEFLEFTGDLYRIPRRLLREQADHFVSLFGLEQHRHSLVRDLSHGLRQRLVYTATFIQRPDLLFVDEPFVGLDPYSIRLIKGLLREKVRQGMTVFLTTHILALAEDLADRVAILSEGELVACGSLEEVALGTEGRKSLEEVFLELTAGDRRAGLGGEAP